jgi:threonine dehydratase
VYAVSSPTPLDVLHVDDRFEVFLKREDLSPIHAYKWRGAYNRMAMLDEEERARGVVTASAGNHAQGVALAAQRLNIDAQIFMPFSTPRMKQIAVLRHGGDRVKVVLHGDTYDAAAALANQVAKDEDREFIHAYNDYGTMGGQGTLADEVVMSGKGPFDIAYIQIGGGGLAAAVACWLRAFYPDIRIVGVEGVDQASMLAAMKAGGPVTLDYIDVFCDGTAVKRAGSLTYPLCAEFIDEIITVTNEEVCAAIQLLWETLRCIPEPAGAMGVAGLMKQREQLAGKRALCIQCGANMDFGQLAWIAQHAGIGAARRRYYRFAIGETQGSLLGLLEAEMDGLNIVEFQYGKVHETDAWPVIGVEASAPELELLDKRLREHGVNHSVVTSAEDVEFRIIHYDSTTFRLPYFIKLEFPERAGALHDFLVMARGMASIVYFNYQFTGEQVGHALLGFEFDSETARGAFTHTLVESEYEYVEIGEDVLKRVL